MSSVIENLDVGVARPQSPHEPGSVPSGAGGEAIFFEEQGAIAPLGEMVQCRAADNTSA